MTYPLFRYKVSRQFEYSYIQIDPKAPKNNQYILFLHGWPSIAHEWHYQIDHFSQLGYGIIAPDLLGYGGTSRPTDLEEYRLKAMAQDIIEILDHKGITEIKGVGHDWGSYLLGRMAVHFPEKLSKLAFLAVGYRPPGTIVDLDNINNMSEKKLGYPIFGYQRFFNETPDAIKLLDENPESITSLIYTADPELWKVHLAPIGALENWMRSGSKTKVAEYISEEDQQLQAKTVAAGGGYGPSLNWYKAFLRNLNYSDEKDLPEESKLLRQPTLFIGAARDFIGIPDLQEQAMCPVVPNLKIMRVDTSHWLQLEGSDEVNGMLEDFFEDEQDVY